MGLLLVLEVVRVELLVLRGEGGTRYPVRDEGRTGVLVKPQDLFYYLLR